MKITTCPILDAAYEKCNWDYLETCDMADVAEKIWQLGKRAGANESHRFKEAV
jgi:hypothetical protein